MNGPGVEFAIVAPVPGEYVRSGADVAAEQGFVAFGSRKWGRFREVDRLGAGRRVPVLIYLSHEDDSAKLTFQVTWVGWYIDHVNRQNGAHPEGMKHRPPSTADHPADNIGFWAIFWHAAGVRELPPGQHPPISSLEGYKSGYWRKNHPPRGPEIVAMPLSLRLEAPA